jgi:predicted kinase
MFAPIESCIEGAPRPPSWLRCDHIEVVDLVLVNGRPGSGKTTLANGLANRLGVPLLAKDAIKEAVTDVVSAVPGPAVGMAAGDMMWTLAAAMSGTVILESWWFTPRDLPFVEAGLLQCGPTSVIEAWCDVPSHFAKSRCAARHRHRIHDDKAKLADAWPRWEAEAEPLGIGPVVRVDTSTPVTSPTSLSRSPTPGCRPRHTAARPIGGKSVNVAPVMNTVVLHFGAGIHERRSRPHPRPPGPTSGLSVGCVGDWVGTGHRQDVAFPP